MTMEEGRRRDYNDFSLKDRGMQKTKEPKKPLQTNRTDAKISIRFDFGFLYNKTENFGLVFSGKF